ncbi:MAG: biotin/lipoyl-containing protein [Chloroflexota bacterium]|nr:hypothetical protein [Anaerolineales bacterium]MCB8965585.1 biotin/lipoyl-binding protein [Ardenticatenaceae bacterium]
MATVKVNVNQQEVELDVTRQGGVLRIERDGVAAELHLIDQGDGTLLLEELLPDGQRRRVQVFAHLSGDKRQVWVNGRTFSYERVRERGSGAAANEGALAATIPAVVSQVLVQVGDVVDEGDKLILLESMKMVIPIQAPYAGTVTAVHCTAGDSVPAGELLVEVMETAV